MPLVAERENPLIPWAAWKILGISFNIAAKFLQKEIYGEESSLSMQLFTISIFIFFLMKFQPYLHDQLILSNSQNVWLFSCYILALYFLSLYFLQHFIYLLSACPNLCLLHAIAPLYKALCPRIFCNLCEYIMLSMESHKLCAVKHCPLSPVQVKSLWEILDFWYSLGTPHPMSSMKLDLMFTYRTSLTAQWLVS